jgi:hypothetical protein
MSCLFHGKSRMPLANFKKVMKIYSAGGEQTSGPQPAAAGGHELFACFPDLGYISPLHGREVLVATREFTFALQ